MSKRTPPATAADATCATRTPLRLRTAAGALALVLAAACVDRTATEPELRPPPDASGPAASLTCRADVRAGTLECAPPTGAGGASAVILGGQGTNVRLRSTGMSYDGTSTFRMDVTVENLTGQVLGTADGATPAPEGVRVFFASGPASATGAVEVANATGEAFFTAAGQKYFQYDGLLPPGDTTPPLEWRFSVPPSVESFQFSVYVAAAVAHEEGWLRIAPFLPSIAVGESMPLSVQRMDVAGRPLPGGDVAWVSNDTTIVRVAPDGTITGMATGYTLVFAIDGTRASVVVVRVFSSAGDAVPPTIHELTLTPTRLTADGADSVTMWARVTDGGTGTRFFSMMLRSPSGAHTIHCSSYAPATGTPTDGTFTCRAAVPPMSEGGIWKVYSVTAADWAGNQQFASADPVLREAGVPRHVYVHSATPDLVAPTFNGVAFSPDSIEANGGDSTTVELQMADGGSGVTEVSASFRNPRGNDGEFCTTYAPSEGSRASGTFRCRIAIPYGGDTGNWKLELRARDATGNTRELGTAQLDSAGYPTILKVTSAPADTLPPSLTGFSFSPDTVAANGLDSVTVRVEVTDAGIGAYRAVVFFRRLNQVVGCTGFTQAPLHPGPQVITCRLAFPSGRPLGEWRAYAVDMQDALGNSSFVTGPELQGLGYPIILTVTP
jgi:hypothetical protein